MRITILVPHLRISGGVKIACEYARRLAARWGETPQGHSVPRPDGRAGRKHQVILLVRQRHLSLWRNIAHKFINLVGWIDLSGVAVRFVPSFDRFYVPDGDAVLATSWKTARALDKLDKTVGRKFYLVQHLEHLLEPPESAKEAEATYRLGISKIAVSRWLQQELMARYQQPSEYVPNAIDPTEFFPENKAHGTKKLGMLYHTADWKGFADGIKALAIVRQSVPDIKLALFGARHRRPQDIGMNYEYYQDASPAVLRRLYSDCDVFICPSWYEGFGLPSLEAMACQTALATTDTGGGRDYAAHNDTALVSPSKDPQALAENIVKLLQDADLLKRVSEGGCRKSQQFRWDESINRMEKVLCQAPG